MLNSPIEEDEDVRAALDWLAEVSGDAAAFRTRLQAAHHAYREAIACEDNLGKDLGLEQLGLDKVASYLAQADALLHDRSSYDLQLSSRIVPFVKHVGSETNLLRQMPGADERANRMLRHRQVDPGSAMFELSMAVTYAQEGYAVEFIRESADRRSPDLRVQRDQLLADVECKRLQKGAYEIAESERQRVLFDSFAHMVSKRGLSVHVDVTYTRELADIPTDYLESWVMKAIGCRIVTPSGFPWKDEYGEGLIKPANLAAVHRDTKDSSLYFGPKMARLLTGRDVAAGSYNMEADAKPDARDIRYIDELYYCSVVTWQCVAEGSLDARARYIQSKLAEVDKQLRSSPAGIVHIAMEAERDTHAADLRRLRNMAIAQNFAFDSQMAAVYLHYLVPRVTEVTTWMIDETVDGFGSRPIGPLRTGQIFTRSTPLGNNLAAWHQSPPKPPM